MSRSKAHEVPSLELAPGYKVPRILCGGWQLSRGHRQKARDPQLALDEMRRLAEAGLSTFDCGDIYVGVEELLGRLIRLFPAVQVHTKFVPDRDRLANIDRRHVEQIVDRSLQRLGVERLDLLQFAWWDYDVPRYVETAMWLDDQRRAGKIRLLGATNFDVEHLSQIVDAGVRLAAHQVQYSPLDRRPDRGMAAYCRQHGIHLLAYGTLGGGFLSEKYLDLAEPAAPLVNRSLVKYRLMIDEFCDWARFQALLRALHRIAQRHGVSIANVAVRSTLERPGVAAAIVGAFDAGHLDDNLRVFEFELDETDRNDLEAFEDAGPPGDVYGVERERDGRHAAIMKYNLNREADD